MKATSQRAHPPRFEPSAARRQMERKIHVARKQLAMDEDDYRQVMLTATGQKSMRDCTDGQLERLIDALKRKGFKAVSAKVSAASHPMATKARALWISLFHLGVVQNPAEVALEAFAARQLGCDKLSWARQSEGFRLIEALKNMGERAGWTQHDRVTRKPLDVIGLQSSLCHAILAKLKAVSAVPQDWWLADAARELGRFQPAPDGEWTVEDYQGLAAAMGKQLRLLVPANGDRT